MVDTEATCLLMYADCTEIMIREMAENLGVPYGLVNTSGKPPRYSQLLAELTYRRLNDQHPQLVDAAKKDGHFPKTWQKVPIQYPAGSVDASE